MLPLLLMIIFAGPLTPRSMAWGSFSANVAIRLNLICSPRWIASAGFHPLRSRLFLLSRFQFWAPLESKTAFATFVGTDSVCTAAGAALPAIGLVIIGVADNVPAVVAVTCIRRSSLSDN